MQPIIIKQRDVRLQSQPSSCGSKEVELLRDGDVVRALRLKCSCGEVTVIELEYQDAAPAAGTDPKQ